MGKTIKIEYEVAGLDHELDGVQRKTLKRIVEHYEAELAEAREVVACICINAAIQPDAAMGGATDCYAVPLDDIARARAFAGRVT